MGDGDRPVVNHLAEQTNLVYDEFYSKMTTWYAFFVDQGENTLTQQVNAWLRKGPEAIIIRERFRTEVTESGRMRQCLMIVYLAKTPKE
ncbi:hypothetical protein ACFL2D_03205 [Patescibacteria group bacterium]